jgi:GNAT superfamily N-acetyltransferase
MQIRPARPDEAGIVAGVLSAAAAELAQRGQALWGEAEVGESSVAEAVRGGRYFVAFERDEPVGVFRLDTQDRLFWPEVTDAASVFLHKLAVHPRSQGSGVAHALLAHACDVARERGHRFLRLDCMGGRPKLRAVYEGFGFRHHSDKVLGSQVFHKFEYAISSTSP